MSGRDAVARDLAVVACAISAGVHAALAPAHLDEGTAAGAGFAGSAVLLALLAVAATRRASQVVLAAISLTLAGLILAYALVVTTGVPVLHPSPEPADGLGLGTKAVELVGLGAALRLLGLRRPLAATLPLRPKGTHS